MSLSSSALQTLLTQFQTHYPMGWLLSELLTVHDGTYAVRAMAKIGDTILATGMAAAPNLEEAEDRAKLRALEALPMRNSISAGGIAPGLTEQPTLSTPAWTAEPYKPMPNSLRPGDRPAHSALPQEAPLPAVTTPNSPDPSPPASPVPGWTPPAQPAAIGSTAINSVVADFYSHINADEDEMPGLPDMAPRTSTPSWEESSPPSQDEPQVAAPTAPPAADNKPRRKSTPTPTNTSPVSVDLSDVIAQTDVELARLGWSKTQGREHLKQTYNKRSRQELDETELYDFLNYLQSQ